MVLWINNKNHLNKIGESQQLADVFHDICLLATKEPGKDYDSTGLIDCRINRMNGYIARTVNNKKLAHKLLDLKDELIKANKESYNKGKADGKNLLVLLNKGEITINELES